MPLLVNFEKVFVCAAGETTVKLCQNCSDSCGILDEEFTVPVDSLGDLPFGTVFPRQSSMQCRSNVCVPSHVSDPKALCRVVADEALLYHTRRLLSVSTGIFREVPKRTSMHDIVREGCCSSWKPLQRILCDYWDTEQC